MRNAINSIIGTSKLLKKPALILKKSISKSMLKRKKAKTLNGVTGLNNFLY